MRFARTDDQVAFRDAVRELLAKECPPAAVRAAWAAPVGELDRGVWDSLDAMGVLGLLVAESDGGMGLDETYLVPILEECGRVALPHPIVETAMVAAPLIGVRKGMVSTDLGGPHVPCAADADTLLLRHGDAIVCVAPSDAELTAVDTVDRARRAGRVHSTEPATQRHATDGDMSQVHGADDKVTAGAAADKAGRDDEATAGTDMQIVADDPHIVDLAIDRGALGTAAILVGLGQAMLDLTVGYVRERHQFGVPVGSFQAVKHHLADVALALEFARPAVWRAAWSVAHDTSTRARDVSMAKALANDAAELAGRKALQCHGAIGYTVEADLHLYMKRTWALSRSWGDTAHHTRRVASALST
ncbi:MAG: acyl-CoA dehydrogenase family protein [Actinomycetota bacterium]